ncbi:MAG TPA: hypothetical protein VK184_06785 [Nostocaceae cyanobacterium]|nr:hypothetical protein [Nostocaceae cyanobacterium]
MDILTVAGISLKLIHTADGFSLGKQRQELESLAWVVNSAVVGAFQKVIKNIEHGEDAVIPGLFAVRPDPDEDNTEARNLWQKLTDEDPGEDTYLVGTTFTEPSILVPRKALQEMISALQILRQQPNLLTSKNEVNQNQTSKEDISLPISSTLEETHKQIDELVLRDLEERAVLLDTLEKGEQNLEVAATISAKRRFLLIEMNEAGLFDPALADEMREKIEQLQLPVLLNYHIAAMKLINYLESNERKYRFPNSASPTVLDASVSIDWFRLYESNPEKYQPYEWLAFCESILCRSNNGVAGTGKILSRIANEWYKVFWRRDNGVIPAIVSIQPLNVRI